MNKLVLVGLLVLCIGKLTGVSSFVFDSFISENFDFSRENEKYLTTNATYILEQNKLEHSKLEHSKLEQKK